MVRRAALVCIVAGVLALAGMTPAQATFTSTLVGTTATVTGDASVVDQVTIGKVEGNLTLNGSPDWDSVMAGDQVLPDTTAATVVVNAGDGIDIITVNQSATAFASTITVNGQGGADFLTVDVDGGDADGVWITGNRLDVFAGHVFWDTAMDQVNIRTGDGYDVIHVDGTPTSPQVLVYGGDGADHLEFANGQGLGPGGVFRGGPGSDTLNYQAYTTPVVVDLGKTARFRAALSGAGAVPPSANVATADAFVDFTDLATSTFGYEVDVDGLTAAQITDAHIHQGAAGVNGAAVLTIGPGSSWTDPGAGTTPSTEVGPMTDADITEPALRAGNTYLDVHSAAGDIRGQLTLDPNDGYGGSATGMSRVYTTENVLSGSGDDILIGSVPHNTFECGGGQDAELTDLGDTLTFGCERSLASATVTGVSPASPADNLTPKVKGTTTPAGLNVKIYTNPTCSGAAAASGTAAQFSADGIPVPVADGSLTTFYATAADTGAESACSSTSAQYQELAPVPAPAPVGSVSKLKPKAKAKGARITIDSGAVASCPATATGTCTVAASATAKIGKKVATLGKLATNVASGQSIRPTITVSKKNAVAWRKAGKLKITFTITLTVPSGTPVMVTRAVKLRAPART